MSFLGPSAFSTLLGVSERHARRILAGAVAGKAWQGHHLLVVAQPSENAASGPKYAVAASSLPVELQERARLLDLPLREPVARLSHGEIADWQREEANFRLHVLAPVLSTQAGTAERAEAIRLIGTRTYRDRKGKEKRVSCRIARMWLNDYEAGGLSGLAPKPSPVKGTRRALISRAWDADIDLDDAARAEVEAELAQYGRNCAAAGLSTRKVAELCGAKLAELSQHHGSGLSRQKLKVICALTKKWAMRFDEFRRVDRFQHDNKAWDDRDKPRIARRLSDLPMDVVFGDVHPIDIYMQLPDNPKRQIRLRLIAWLDDATRYLWATLAAFGPGTGVRKTDVADSLFNLVVGDEGGGLPVNFYFDNGGEYNAVAEAVMEFPEVSGLISGRGRIRAKPYNGSAKPIEGVFKILEQGYFKFIPGWIGGDRSNKKTHQVGKPVKPFGGTLDDLADAIRQAIAAYNDAPQNDGKLAGLSPREAMERAVQQGWEPQRTDARSFDEVFSERDVRSVKQGCIEFGQKRYTSDFIQGLGYRDRVEVRAPLRSGTEAIFIRYDGVPQGEAWPDVAYHPLDRAGAIEASRRIGVQKAAIAKLKAQLDPKFDAFAELTRNTNQSTPAQDRPGTLIRLAGEEPARRLAREKQQEEATSRRWSEIMAGQKSAEARNERKASG